MNGHLPYFSAFVLAFFLFVPAIISLFFAWSVWIANKRPAIAGWRLHAFRSGLILAPITTLVLFLGAARYLRTQAPAEGAWLIGNRVGLLLWVAVFGGALVGKGKLRILLLSWWALLFLGVFGVSSIIP